MFACWIGPRGEAGTPLLRMPATKLTDKLSGTLYYSLTYYLLSLTMYLYIS